MINRPIVYESVIFDMDGVLLDSQPLHYQIDLALLQQLGHQAPYSAVSAYGGMRSPDRMNLYRSAFQLPQSQAALVQQHEVLMMETFAREPLQAIEGIVPLLTYLQDKGKKMAVASSSARPLIDLILHKLQIRSYFNVIVAGEDVSAGKPAPDIFLFAARQLETAPAQCVVVEDSVYGVQSAAAAGMYCIAYRNPHSGVQDLSLAGQRIDHFSEALSLL